MKMKGNCFCIKSKWECRHLRRPLYHPGFTSKSGIETWWMCALKKVPIRNIKSCELSFSKKENENDNKSGNIGAGYGNT